MITFEVTLILYTQRKIIMSRSKWIAEDGAENAANNIKLNNTLDELKLMIQSIALRLILVVHFLPRQFH